uniref:Regulatory protein zeste n=1 Tax=Timema poppense TaxID=170557 RepID=A0A7R9H8T8_TIMPO|nr:unnamed protein product [Timema poppensis]
MEGRGPAETPSVKIESEDYLDQLLHKGVLFYETVNCAPQQEGERGSNTHPRINNVDLDTLARNVPNLPITLSRAGGTQGKAHTCPDKNNNHSTPGSMSTSETSTESSWSMLIDVKCSSNTFGNIDNNASNTEALAFEAVDVLMIKEEIQEITNKPYTNTNTSIRQSSVPTKESANVMSNDEQPERLPASGSPKAKMAKRLRSGRVIGRQWEFLVDYMVRHPALAIGKLMGPQGAINATQQWTKLSQQLNELGPKKSTNQWKKVWRDLKRNTKARAATVNAVLKQTDNLNVEDKLTALDKKVIAVIGWESNTGIPEPSTAEMLTDSCPLSEASSSNSSSSLVTTVVDEPKPTWTDNELEEDRVRPTPSTENAATLMVPCPQPGSSPTLTVPCPQPGSSPTLTVPCPQPEPSNTQRSTTKRKRCDDYEERFLRKFTQIQEENVTNARTTAEQMTVLGTAFTKIATATDRMATAIEIMSTAITKLAESIANKDLLITIVQNTSVPHESSAGKMSSKLCRLYSPWFCTLKPRNMDIECKRAETIHTAPFYYRNMDIECKRAETIDTAPFYYRNMDIECKRAEAIDTAPFYYRNMDIEYVDNIFCNGAAGAVDDK